MDLNIDVIGLERWLRRFAGADKIVSEEMAKAGRKSGLAVEALAKQYVVVDTGHLRRSITSAQSPFGTTISPLATVTRVGTNVPYAKAVEYGTGLLSTAPDSKHTRHYPPPQALDSWAIRHGFHVGSTASARTDVESSPGSVGWIVSQIIGRRGGLKPRPYLIKAFNELTPKIRAEFGQVPKRVIARLKAGN